MTFLKKYFWFILVVAYLIWPWDLHPTLLDDVMVFAIYLAYILMQAKKIGRDRTAYQQAGAGSGSRSRRAEEDGDKGPMDLQTAYRLLRVAPESGKDEIRRAYHARVAANHPDKVSHLSEELQQRAQELTQRLNLAYDIIRRHRHFKS